MTYDWGKFDWAETLPKACPPGEAKEPNRISFFRLVESFPPTQQDFYSYRMLYPNKAFRLGECVARSVSIFTSCEECSNIKKLPQFKNDNKIIIMINLPPESGVVLQTGVNRYHFSWWRTKDFNPIPYCQKAII
jgi:hypothetical protein